MGSSLETLVDNVTSVEGEIHFKQLRKVFPSEQQAKLLLQKQMSIVTIIWTASTNLRKQNYLLETPFLITQISKLYRKKRYKHAQDV